MSTCPRLFGHSYRHVHGSGRANPAHLSLLWWPVTLKACESGRQRNKLTLCSCCPPWQQVKERKKISVLPCKSVHWQGVSVEASSKLLQLSAGVWRTMLLCSGWNNSFDKPQKCVNTFSGITSGPNKNIKRKHEGRSPLSDPLQVKRVNNMETPANRHCALSKF